MSVLPAAALLEASAFGTVASAKGVHRAAPQYGGTLVWALPEQADINWYFPLANSSNDSLYNFQLLDQLYLPLLYVTWPTTTTSTMRTRSQPASPRTQPVLSIMSL